MSLLAPGSHGQNDASSIVSKLPLGHRAPCTNCPINCFGRQGSLVVTGQQPCLHAQVVRLSRSRLTCCKLQGQLVPLLLKGNHFWARFAKTNCPSVLCLHIYHVTGNAWLSRTLRMTVIYFWGRWYLPVPNRPSVVTVVGAPIQGTHAHHMDDACWTSAGRLFYNFLMQCLDGQQAGACA